ncbi:MAG TPA: DUF4382 domain-containing protein [Ramlibacter sp.]|nr:DUF4382 domain-containing protein [Ramlibacter sp.]
MDSTKLRAGGWTVASRWILWPAIGAALAACGGGGGGSGDQASTSVLQARSIDRGCSFERVFITVEKIRVRQRSAGPDEQTGWTGIALPAPRRIDLMNLGGGLLQALGAAPLGAGHYTGFRLVLSANSSAGAGSLANAVLSTGGEPVPLAAPGGPGGLELQADFDVPAGQVADPVPVGFDPCRSIVRQGNPGRFVLKPEINLRAVVAAATPERRIDGFIAPSTGGGFVVLRRDLPDGVFAQRFDASGAAVGAEIRIGVNAVTGGSLVGITPLAGGGYAFTWIGSAVNPEHQLAADFPVIVQRYAAGGTLLGSEQDAVSQPIALQGAPVSLPQTVALPGGGFVLAWGQRDPGGFNVYAQRFAADGTAAGTPQLAGAGGGELHVLATAGGGFWVAWGVAPILARAFGPDGKATGDAAPVGAFALLEPGIAPQQAPSVAALADGSYVVAWLGSGVIQARRFAADGAPLGGATRINTAPSTFSGPTAVAIGDGFVVTWAADGAGGSFARFFDANGLLGGTA